MFGVRIRVCLPGRPCAGWPFAIEAAGRREKDFVGWPHACEDMGDWDGASASPLLRRGGRCRQLDRCRRAKAPYLPAISQPANPGSRTGSRGSTDASQRAGRRADAGRQGFSQPRTNGAGSGGGGQGSGAARGPTGEADLCARLPVGGRNRLVARSGSCPSRRVS